MTPQELQGKLSQVEMSSKQLIEMLNGHTAELNQQANAIFSVTQGNLNSGPAAAQRVQMAASKLNEAAESLRQLCSGIDEYIDVVRNA